MNNIFENFGYLLKEFNQPWLSQNQLQMFADAIYEKGVPLNNCWGFIDGTVRPVCRPQENQGIIYNGHKRVHAIKFQSVVAPNELIARIRWPLRGEKA